MKFLPVSSILAALLLSVVISIPFLPGIDRERDYFALEVRMRASTTGYAQLFYDDGGGYRESASVRTPIGYVAESAVYRFPLPGGNYRSFRFDPIAGSASLVIESARIVDAEGELVRQLALSELRPNDHFASSVVTDGELHAEVRTDANDPQFILTFEPRLRLSLPWLRSANTPLRVPLITFAALIVAMYGVNRSTRLRQAGGKLLSWCYARPDKAVLLISALAVVASCYPVVFFGKSFVSPNFSDGSVLLYGRFPTLPGYDESTVENAMGADVGAMAWHHLPLSIIQHRALWRDHELPLWNRYNATGSPLLGQGQSMFGDPLHFLPILAEGAAWAWDLKFLTAKWLFCVGLGLITLRTTKSSRAAWVTALSGAFLGFFVYRVNHPAFFSFCYAPWILYAWLHIQVASNRRGFVPWIGVLMLANWMVMNSGTVKEAYMLLVMLNLTGAALVAGTADPWREKTTKFGWLTGAGVSFGLLSSPIWLTFLDTLQASHTAYDNPAAHQIDPSLLLGLFDEIFYRPIQTQERVFNPSANFLVLIGVFYVIATLRRAPAHRLKLIFLFAALPSLALAFGIVPPEWIVEVPFLRNVVHIDNSFSCVLIIHLLIIAGFGYALAEERLATNEGRGDLAVVGGLLAVLIVPWLALTHTVLREPFGPDTTFRLLDSGEHLPVSGFVWASLLLLPAAAMAVLFLARRAWRRGRWSGPAVLLLITCLLVLLWRHGQHLRFGLNNYVYNPGPRIELLAPSPAIELIRDQTEEPSRVIGVYDNLVPGWSAVYDLEAIAGPDALQNPYYHELTSNLGLFLLWGWRIFARPEEIDTLKSTYDFLNVRYYLDLPGAAERPYKSLRPVTQLDLNVYASDTLWPRAFFTDRVARYDDVRTLGNLVRKGDGRPFAAINRYDEGYVVQFGEELASRTVVPARDYHLTNNTTTFEIEAPSAGVVVLHEAWLGNDFQVSINGRKADYFRINHAFKGVVIARPGSYSVTYRYQPHRFPLTLVLAAGGALLLITGGWIALRSPRSG